MICKQCGAENKRVTYEPVIPPVEATPTPPGDTLTMQQCYKRWACWNCERYHFPDGSLYENPFTGATHD